MPTLIFFRVGACPPCSPRAGAHAHHTHSAYLRQRRSNPNRIFINVKNVIGAIWYNGTSENWGLEDVTVRRTDMKRTYLTLLLVRPCSEY